MARREIFFKEFLCSGICLIRKNEHFDNPGQDINLILCVPVLNKRTRKRAPEPNSLLFFAVVGEVSCEGWQNSRLRRVQRLRNSPSMEEAKGRKEQELPLTGMLFSVPPITTLLFFLKSQQDALCQTADLSFPV